MAYKIQNQITSKLPDAVFKLVSVLSDSPGNCFHTVTMLFVQANGNLQMKVTIFTNDHLNITESHHANFATVVFEI